MKPIIGITPLLDDNTQDTWMHRGYMDCILEAGGIPVILPLCDDEDIARRLVSECDGFLFTGGPDVDPIMYDIRRQAIFEKPNNMRDCFEKALFEAAIRTEKPILGICRGLQFINVMCGGTLYADILGDDAEVDHWMRKPYNRPQHQVFIYPDTPLYKIIKQGEIAVNSSHHQAICQLAPCLDPMALSPDGYIESFFMPAKRFVHGYQWHPEMHPESEDSKAIFRSFIKACIENIETTSKLVK